MKWMRSSAPILGLVAGLVFGGLFAVDRALPETTDAQNAGRPHFSEIKWPFPLDQWGLGRAYRCDDCGAEVTLLMRTKIGFCNCTTGIADDDEIDRVADFDLIGGRVVPLSAGRPVMVTEVAGRARAFRIEAKNQTDRYTFVVALSLKCDGYVATAILNRPPTPALETAILDFLGPENFSP